MEIGLAQHLHHLLFCHHQMDFLWKNEKLQRRKNVAKTPAWQRKAGKSKSGGLNKKGVASYRKANPGSKLKRAVTTKPSKLKKGSKISKFVTNKQKSLAVRFPKHPLFKKLLKSLDYPLAAPSANMSTRLSSVKASDVIEEFGSKIK